MALPRSVACANAQSTPPELLAGSLLLCSMPLNNPQAVLHIYRRECSSKLLGLQPLLVTSVGTLTREEAVPAAMPAATAPQVQQGCMSHTVRHGRHPHWYIDFI
jgi:hypothetical protein